jgi:hypothetical protein
VTSEKHRGVEQGDEADEAGASDGASQLMRGVGRTVREVEPMSVRRQVLIAPAVVASTTGVPSAEEGPVPSAITFYVYYHNAKGQLTGRPSVEVSRLGSQSEHRLGATNADGEVKIPARDVFTEGAVALLFCDPQFKEHCAALRLDSGLLRGFAEFNVQLPVVESVDRYRISAK